MTTENATVMAPQKRKMIYKCQNKIGKKGDDASDEPGMGGEWT